MDNLRKYSVIITVFNDEKEIQGLVQNVQEQTCPPEEIIIVDGGSEDNTCKIIEGMSKTDKRIVLLSGERLNISQGLNKGIKYSKQEYVGIVATGNKYEKNFFEKLLYTATADMSDFTYGLLKGKRNNKFQSMYCDLFLEGESGIDYGIATNHGVLCKKKAVEECGFFYEDFVYAGEDAEFFQRAKDLGYVFTCDRETAIEWDIPNNLKQYKKQITNYSIGQLQILHGKELLEFYKINFIVSISYLLWIVSIIALSNDFIDIKIICICYIISMSVYLICGILKDRMKFLFKQFMHIYTCYSVLKNIRYNKKKYAVIRE